MRVARIILFVLVTAGLIWLIVILFSKAFSTAPATTTTNKTPLVSYANSDATASMLIDGPVVVDEIHQALRISVDRSQSKVELINGYEGNVVREETFANNTAGYEAFLKALDKALFDSPVSKSISADERGYCPLRNRFVYTLSTGTKDIVRTWTSSCGIGNYTGDRALTRTLFINQIPNDMLRDVIRGTRITLN